MPQPRTREVQAEGVDKRLTPRSRSLVADPHYSRGHLHAWKAALRVSACPTDTDIR